MNKSAFTIRKLACAYFFACPGIAYGIITARMPAIKNSSGSDDSQIGIMLLCLGISSLLALSCSNATIARFGSGPVLRYGVFFMFLASCLCGLAATPFQLQLFGAMLGLGMGFTDVSMNTQAILLERRYHVSCMSSLHAAYSFGGVAGALTGAIFAAFGIGYFLNATSVLACYAVLSSLAGPRLLKDYRAPKTGKGELKGIPFLVFFCGLMSMLSYSIEGSVGEWGSLLLYGYKGASEQLAALVFAVFSVALVISRLFGDRLRMLLGDAILVFVGAALGCAGLSIALFFQNPALCLAGYAIMGLGLAPLVPVYFSRAGSQPNVGAGTASSVVSTMSYSGLLFFPPLLGFVAQKEGLPNALLIVLVACALMAVGSFVFGTK